MFWRLDFLGIWCLWLARAACDGLLAMWCSRGAWVSWLLVVLAAFAAAAPPLLRELRSEVFLPLYAFIHWPLAYLAIGLLAQPELYGGDAGARAYESARLSALGSALGVVGFAIKVTHVPERWFPGRCDIVGASHQLWYAEHHTQRAPSLFSAITSLSHSPLAGTSLPFSGRSRAWPQIDGSSNSD